MRVLITEDHKDYRFENVQKLSVVNGELVLRYIDEKGKDHCEIGKLPEVILAIGE